MTVSAETQRAMMMEATGRTVLTCVTISTEDETAYFVDDSEDLVRTIDGVATTFKAFPFEAALHKDDENDLPEASINIDATDQSIVQLLRDGAGTVPTLIIEVVTKEAPDVVDSGPYRFDLSGATSDTVSTIRLALTWAAHFLTAAFPGRVFSRSNAGADA